MFLTPIHRALGLAPTEELSVGLLEEAVEKSVPETADLDFKSVFYDKRDPNSEEELAKDLAAMANSGGGWIFCGVKDNDDKAVKLTLFEPNPDYEKRLRQVAYTLVQPALLDVSVYEIEGADGRIALAIEVPTSRNTPHLVFYTKNLKDKRPFFVPLRNGPDTFFMSEAQLRAAYRQSEVSHREREAALASDLEDFASLAKDYEGATFVGVARPVFDYSRKLSSTEVMDVSWHLNASVHLKKGERPWLIALDGDNPRKGYRSWVMRHEHDEWHQRYYRVEISENGLLKVAIKLGGWKVPEQAAREYPVGKPNHVVSGSLEAVCVEFWDLMRKLQTEFFPSDYEFKMTVATPDGGPLVIRGSDYTGSGFMANEEASIPTRSFTTVEGFLPVDATLLEQSEILNEAALDLVNQGGIQYLREIKSPQKIEEENK